MYIYSVATSNILSLSSGAIVRCFGSLEFGGLLPEIFGGRLPERAYIVYDPILGGEKYLKYFKRFAGAKKHSKNGTILSQNFRPIFDLAFRSHQNSIQKYPTDESS